MTGYIGRAISALSNYQKSRPSDGKQILIFQK
ncbi:MAG: hypothetical protein ACJAXW_003992 [Candidatus Azotimanducaceae bacterium]|jgi:hypothetical protein